MAKAIVIVKMKTDVQERGQLDVPGSMNFVHTGVDLPGNYHAFVVTGTPAQLVALSQHNNFLMGQEITKTGEVYNWADARTAIAPGAITKANTWLANNGKRTITAEDNIETFLQIFDPDYQVGRDDVFE